MRDRLLGSRRFQRWAVRFPLTRWVARRRARALFDLCAGFVYSQVLFACVKLHLFEHLDRGPLDLRALAPRLGLGEDATTRLLDAARSLGLVERRGGATYALGPLGAAMRGNPGIAAMVEHHSLLYADLEDPVALLRGAPHSRALADYWAYAGAGRGASIDPGRTAPYTALMSASQDMIAAQILDSYPVGRHRCLMDVGGGDGAFLAAAAERAPDLRISLFDLPAVAAQARVRFARLGLDRRASVTGGDFRVDALPTGADLVSLVRVIHDHDDPAALALLRAVRAALPAGGVLLVAEPMADTAGEERIGHAYFGFYLLAMGQGRPRSRAALTALLAGAGFTRVSEALTAMPMLTRVLVARS